MASESNNLAPAFTPSDATTQSTPIAMLSASPTPTTQETIISTNESDAVNSKKRKALPPRSEVWKHFTRFVNDQGEQKARCNYCDRVLSANTKYNGTTSLKNHMNSCKKFPSSTNDSTQTELAFQSGDGSIGTWKFSQEAIRKSLAKMIIRDELPFRFVEREGFKEFVATSCPRFIVPSRWTVARDCFNIFVDGNNHFKYILRTSSFRVSLTTDTWTSIQRENYLCLTAHFIDNDWKLHKRILNFCPIYSHKGEAIGKMIEKCLRDWGISKVFTITVDNASSNDVAIAYLKKKIEVFRK
ncbi:zinc finger protein [Theobroma cacao]|nr:zinc finger protein [Theobroma cacao]